MAIEVFTITKSQRTTASSTIAQDGRLEPVHYADIHLATQLVLVSLPRTLKSITGLTACILEHDDVPNAQKTEVRRILCAISKHNNELDVLRVSSKNLIANLDDARMFFALNFNESVKVHDPSFNAELSHDSYQREMANFSTTLGQAERQKAAFADDFERLHQTYADALFAQYQDIISPAASMCGSKVAARLNRVKLYLNPEGPFFQEGKFLNGAFMHTPRANIILELKDIACALEAESKNNIFFEIPGFPRQILGLRRFISNTAIALGTIATEELDDDEKLGVRDLQTAFTRLFTVDFPALHIKTMDAVGAETESRFRIFDAADAPADSENDPIIKARKVLWETDLKRLCQNSKKLSICEKDFYLSIEIQKVKALIAQPAPNRKTFPELVKFFTEQTRVCANLPVDGTNAQYFACSHYLWPKELLPILFAMKNHINGLIGLLGELVALLLNIIQTVESHRAVTWTDFLLSAKEKQDKITLHENSISLKKRIRGNCVEFLTQLVKINENNSNVWFNSESDFRSRSHLFVLVDPPLDYTKDVTGRKKLIIALRNPIEINILILCLKYYNFVSKIPDIKIEVVSLNSQDLNDAKKLVGLNDRLNSAFAAAASTPLTQFLFVLDEVYLIGGCVREVDRNYKLILLDSFFPGTIHNLFFTNISGVCARYRITFDNYVSLPHYGANHIFAAMETISYLSRQDFNQPTLMTADNNDGFTVQNLNRHIRRLQGSRVIDAIARPVQDSPTSLQVPGLMAQLTQIEQTMTALNTTERIYRLGLRHRWAKLIRIALHDSDFKTQTNAGKSFHATITSVTVAPAIESPALAKTMDELNLFPLVPTAVIERMEAERRAKFEAESLARVQAERRAREVREVEAKAKLEAERRAAPAAAAPITAAPIVAAPTAPQMQPAIAVSPHGPALASAITAAIDRSIIPAAMRSASAPTAMGVRPHASPIAIPPAVTPAHRSPFGWFSRGQGTCNTAPPHCGRCNGVRMTTSPPCPVCKQ